MSASRPAISVPRLGGDGGRAGEQVVAGHDGHQVAEAAVDALDVAPDGRLVDDVVVVERGQVDELDRHAAQQVVLGGVALAAPWPRPGRAAGRRRLPPAAIRWVVTSSRKPSPVTTDAVSRGSRRCSPSCRRGRPRASVGFTARNVRSRSAESRQPPGRRGAQAKTARPEVSPARAQASHGPAAVFRLRPQVHWAEKQRSKERRSGCSNASPTGHGGCWCWRRRKRACSTTASSAPSTSSSG